MLWRDHSGVFCVHLKTRGKTEHGLSFLQVVKDYCCPNYELADALFNDPTYIARAGYE